MRPVNDNIYVLITIGVLGGILLTGGVLYVVISYIRKIGRQKEALRQVELAYQSKLFTAVIASQEEERRRIGREMHDEVGSTLSALRLNLSSRLMHGAEDPAIRDNIRSIDKLSAIVRNISHLLSPPELEYAGFHDALETLCDSLGTGTGVAILLEDAARGTIPPDKFGTALSLYRIFQELITNTLRHAGATEIRIRLYNAGSTFVAVYADNGKGFDTTDRTAAGLGLQSIQSRLLMTGATCRMESQSGNGFRCTIYLEHAHICNA